MLHINKSKSPALSSTMCTRRHKGMLQTTIILVLIVCIGYGFYLYNLLQVQVKYLDTKVLQHQTQRKSLSSQLQAVYEDRARLEKSVQKSKTDLQKIKDDKETIIQQMLIEHQDKNEALNNENKKLMKINKDLFSEKSAIESKHDKIYRDHEELKKKHQEHLRSHSLEVNDAHAEVQVYQKENENMRNIKESLEMQVEEAKEKLRKVLNEKESIISAAQNTEEYLNEKNNEISNLKLQIDQHVKDKDIVMKQSQVLKQQYEEIKQALNAVPADAINFNHPVLQSLASEKKQILNVHLGEARGGAQFQQQVQQNHLVQEKQQQQQDRLQQIEEERRQRILEAQNHQQVEPQGVGGDQNQGQYIPVKEPVIAQTQQKYGKNVIDICALTVDPGPCHDGKIRFGYYDGLQACRGFMWGGCGGNQNNFESMEECAAVCNDPKRRYIEKELTEEQQVVAMQKAGMLDQVAADNNDKDVKQPDNNDQDDEEQRLTEEEELRARQQEEEARKELQKQSDMNPNFEEDGRHDADPLEELKENSKRQYEVAKNQQADMEKLVEQQQQRDQQALPPQPQENDQIEAKIEDDEEHPGNEEEEEDEEENLQNDDDNGEVYYRNDNNAAHEEEEDEGINVDHPGEDPDDRVEKNEDDDNVQVDLPPAARVAGDNPEAVMNAPPPNQDGIDSKDINGQDIYEQDEQEEQDGKEEEDEKEDAIEYREDNQQEEKGGEDENGEDVEEDYGDEPGREDDNRNNDSPKQEDDNNYDNYENEENDPQEEKKRRVRLWEREQNDKVFESHKGIQDMIPKNAKHIKEM
ncbi:uncharacterized protein LOC120327588 isoform X1 [Styela clava]